MPGRKPSGPKYEWRQRTRNSQKSSGQGGARETSQGRQTWPLLDTTDPRPATGGRGRSGRAAARGCDGRWPDCGACPWLGFAARGRCGTPPGFLRGRIYFRQGWGWGEGRRRRGACPSAAVGTAWRSCVDSRSRSLLFARRRRRIRQQGASRGFSAKCSAHGTSDSKTLPEYSRDPHAMDRNAHTACCVRV